MNIFSYYMILTFFLAGALLGVLFGFLFFNDNKKIFEVAKGSEEIGKGHSVKLSLNSMFRYFILSILIVAFAYRSFEVLAGVAGYLLSFWLYVIKKVRNYGN
ncbi:hypothetical protein KAW80_03720 [Candidatus Babeliales bacterium]|nr:hypothetical protein [Candidatus Babeliales bacterium]